MNSTISQDIERIMSSETFQLNIYVNILCHRFKLLGTTVSKTQQDIMRTTLLDNMNETISCDIQDKYLRFAQKACPKLLSTWDIHTEEVKQLIREFLETTVLLGYNLPRIATHVANIELSKTFSKLDMNDLIGKVHTKIATDDIHQLAKFAKVDPADLFENYMEFIQDSNSQNLKIFMLGVITPSLSLPYLEDWKKFLTDDILRSPPTFISPNPKSRKILTPTIDALISESTPEKSSRETFMGALREDLHRGTIVTPDIEFWYTFAGIVQKFISDYDLTEKLAERFRERYAVAYSSEIRSASIDASLKELKPKIFTRETIEEVLTDSLYM